MENNVHRVFPHPNLPILDTEIFGDKMRYFFGNNLQTCQIECPQHLAYNLGIFDNFSKVGQSNWYVPTILPGMVRPAH